jgi:hypothetical protein
MKDLLNMGAVPFLLGPRPSDHAKEKHELLVVI